MATATKFFFIQIIAIGKALSQITGQSENFVAVPIQDQSENTCCRANAEMATELPYSA